jgi:hypothetical protein
VEAQRYIKVKFLKLEKENPIYLRIQTITNVTHGNWSIGKHSGLKKHNLG